MNVNAALVAEELAWGYQRFSEAHVDLEDAAVLGGFPPCTESVFRLQGPADTLVTAFFAAARAFHRDGRMNAMSGRG